MRKAYITPETMEMYVESAEMLASSPTIDYTDEKADPEIDPISLSRRGTWGNRWEN